MFLENGWDMSLQSKTAFDVFNCILALEAAVLFNVAQYSIAQIRIYNEQTFLGLRLWSWFLPCYTPLLQQCASPAL